jgi:hypothetical protein
MGEEYYCNIIKIINYEGILGFIQQKIDIRPFYPAPQINNDTIINGSLKVIDSEGKHLIQTDNISKVVAVYNKLGINQEIFNVKGLLDIDNIAYKDIDVLLSDFSEIQLDSYSITEALKPVLTFTNITDSNIETSINNQYSYAMFHTYIYQSIEDGDIVFDHLESDDDATTLDFGSGKITTDSFAKIKKIVTEVYNMIYLENLPLNENSILTFVETLSDSTGIYLCSMRCLLRYNQIDNTWRIFFITTYLPVNDQYNNASDIKDLDMFITKLSTASRFLNLSRTLLDIPEISQNLLNGVSNDGTSNTFTGFIDNSKYFRNRFDNPELYCFIYQYPGDEILTVLNEKYPFWQNKPGITNYIPNTDISLDKVSDIVSSTYIELYGDFKLEYAFPLDYYFDNGMKISFINTIQIGDKKFLMGCGVYLTNIISESILSKGDTKLTGNLSIIDEETNNYILNVDVVNKQSFSMYNTGIGTNNPQSKLDINDCGLYDIINIINILSQKFNILNFNLSNPNPNFMSLKKYININGINNISNYFNNYLVDPTIDGTNPSNNNKIVQSKDNYYNLNEIPYDNYGNALIDNVVISYNYLHPEWNGRTLLDIVTNEIQNKAAANYLLKAIQDTNVENMYFDGSYRITYYPWVNGIKVNIGYTFKICSKVYLFMTGVDIQNNLNVETNTNIVNFLETTLTHSNRLQQLIKNKINPSIVINENVSKLNRQKHIQNYSSGKVFKYVVDMHNKQNTTIQELNIDDFTPLYDAKTFNNLNTNVSDFQLKNKLTLFGITLTQYFSASWLSGTQYTLQPYFIPGCYGIIHCEDDYYDYCSTFWLESIDITSVPGSRLLTFYSFETKIIDVINSTIENKGDFKLKGDLYVYDRSKNENFILIDANNRFLGFNTSQVYGNYSNTYSTTSNASLAKHNVYIKTNGFPNTVLERTSENPNPAYSPSDDQYYYFQAFSTLSSRRQSDYFTFDQMNTYGKQYTSRNYTDVKNAFGPNTTNKYGYGSGLAYEIKDNTGVVKELGAVYMVMEDLSKTNVVIDGQPQEVQDVKGAFAVNVIDRVPNSLDVNLRTLMYCSNDSNLYVNNVTTNGIQFGGHPDNNTTYNSNNIQTGITNGPKLWVDDQGRLRFGSGVDTDKVVNLSDPNP